MKDTPGRSSPPQEFLLLLTSHQSTLYASITALLGGVEGAQDVLQETNLVLLEKAGEFDLSRPFLPWALTVARFQMLACANGNPAAGSFSTTRSSMSWPIGSRPRTHRRATGWTPWKAA